MSVQPMNDYDQNKAPRVQPVYFAQINQRVLENLDWPVAGWIWAHYRSKPQSWIVMKAYIRNKYEIGQDLADEIFTYLRKNNLLAFVRERLPNGTFGETHETILNGEDWTPMTREQCKEKSKKSSKNPDSMRVQSRGVKKPLLVKNLPFNQRGEKPGPGETVTSIDLIINNNLDLSSSLLSDQEKDKKEINNISVFSKKKKKRKSNLSKEEEILFSRFYKMYPKKKDVEDAKLAFQDYHSWEDLPEIEKDLIELKRAKRDPEWLKENGQFIPYPATYLRNRRWQDEWQDGSQEPLIAIEIIDKFETHKGFTTPEAWRVYRPAYEEGTLPERYLPHYHRLEPIFGKPATHIPPNHHSLNGGGNLAPISSFFDTF